MLVRWGPSQQDTTLLTLAGRREEERIRIPHRQGIQRCRKRLWQELQKDTQDKLPLTVHRHCPRKHIHGFQFVQFGREKIERLIEAGCQDALKHDCEEARCLLPK